MLADFDMLEEARKKAKAEQEEANKRYEQIRIESLKKKGIDPYKYSNEYKHHGNCDSIYSLENGEATFLWLIVMVGGSIFSDRWTIWIVTTVIWFIYIMRHDR